MKQGETVDVPILLNSTNNEIKTENTVQPLVDFPGPAGMLSLTAVGNRVEYKISMSTPADSFVGILSITNVTSGFSQGRYDITKFSGSVTYNGYYNNRYGASLNGIAYLSGKPVAKTVTNYITWVYK
ncbi:hypothetical protein [Bacillus benzoevorans]|uniref:hypothetical protein n=1 Tax=Bacillus benzoevorans TaxID=1456 RepID=UPI0016221727|nr:hypothetical protein [Bacillus benzoevorans]